MNTQDENQLQLDFNFPDLESIDQKQNSKMINGDLFEDMQM